MKKRITYVKPCVSAFLLYWKVGNVHKIIDAHRLKIQARPNPGDGVAQIFAKIPRGGPRSGQNFLGSPILGFIAFLLASLLKYAWRSMFTPLPPSPPEYIYAQNLQVTFLIDWPYLCATSCTFDYRWSGLGPCWGRSCQSSRTSCRSYPIRRRCLLSRLKDNPKKIKKNLHTRVEITISKLASNDVNI